MAWWQTDGQIQEKAKAFESSVLPEIGVLRKLVENQAYTLTDADHGYTIFMKDNSTSRAVTIPYGLKSDFVCSVVRYGTAAVTFSAGSGATLRSPGSAVSIDSQYGEAGIKASVADGEYLLGGQLG